MAGRTSQVGGGQQPPQEQIETGYGKPKTGGAFSQDPTQAGGGGGMPGAYKPDPNKPGRNVPGENSAFKPADPWSEMSPENQVGFESAVARGKKISEADIERQKGYPKFDGVDEKGNPISWEELDKQYMPGQTDSETVAEKDLTRPDDNWISPESELMAFSESGDISQSASSTVEAADEADSMTGALGEGASSMVSGGSGGGSSGEGLA